MAPNLKIYMHEAITCCCVSHYIVYFKNDCVPHFPWQPLCCLHELSLASRVKKNEAEYAKAFQDEVAALIQRVEKRAEERIQEAMQEVCTSTCIVSIVPFRLSLLSCAEHVSQ
jgi:hypothetical protein